MSNEPSQTESSEAGGDAWESALAEQAAAAGDAKEPVSAAGVTPADFDALTPGMEEAGASDGNLDMILDIPVSIALEIGRAKISIRNLLQLNQGSVVELDRLAGEPLDVLVNGTLIAHGEVVMINEKFGIRLTDVISPGERVKNLQ